MPELMTSTYDSLLRLAAQKRAAEPLDLKELMAVGTSAEDILDALFELDARRQAARDRS